VLLVDWELAAVGDPALDVGAYLAECLRAWRRHAGVPDPHAPGRRLVDPLRALPSLWPAVAGFWAAYGGDAVLLRRAVQCAGARLVLDALEETQSQSALDENVRATLQLGANVLARPEDAAVHLLGLPGAA
jgi:aminoglycoside phosphotransferase (APT) family kinase protein